MIKGEEMDQNRITNLSRLSINLIVVIVMILSMSFGGIHKVAADASPTLAAKFPNNLVQGFRWPLGTPVTLNINDPSNGPGVDYTDTLNPEVPDWDPTTTFINFELQGFQLQPGQVVSMSNGVITKDLETTNLQVSTVDPAADTVTGTAQPGSDIFVGMVCDDNGCAGRNVVANANGDWTADFSVPGAGIEEQTLIDIRPGTNSEAHQYDADGTVYFWEVPPLPVVVANLSLNQVYSETWPLGSNVTVTIDDASNGPGVDFTDYGVVGEAPWGDPNFTWVEFFPETIILDSGDLVTLSGNSFTKELTVEPL
jgi:hypothetical protein